MVGYDGVEREGEGDDVCEEFGGELGGEFGRGAVRGVFLFVFDEGVA